MRKIKYLLQNKSYSTGMYVVNKSEHVLGPLSTIILPIEPTSVTNNITKSLIVEDVPEPKVRRASNQNKETTEETVKGE